MMQLMTGFQTQEITKLNTKMCTGIIIRKISYTSR